MRQFKILKKSIYQRIKNKIFNFFDLLRFKITGWERELYWCPSQLTKTFKHGNHTVIAYMRWRWMDPWTGNFYFINKNGNYIWSEDIIEKYNFDSDTPIRTLEKKMEEKIKYYFKDKKEKIRFENYSKFNKLKNKSE